MSQNIHLNSKNKIKIRETSASDLFIRAIFGVLILLTVIGFVTIDTNEVNLIDEAKNALSFFGIMFGTPEADASHFGLARDASGWYIALETGSLILQTLALAFLTTLIGAVIALVLGLLAARNLTNPHLSNFLKGFVAIIRAIPTVLWVLIFAIGSGLGSVAAVVGMSFHTVGFLLKAYSESFEELDHGVIEALRASGAGWLSIVFQAILPSSLTYLLSWTFIRFEINFGVAVAMGAAAGAGGIGFNLFMSAGYFFDIQEIGYITYWILGVALIMEVVATRLKKRYHIHS